VSGDVEWKAAADRARNDIFDLIFQDNLLICYLARRVRVARATFKMNSKHATDSAQRAAQNPRFSFSNRPSADRIDGECVQGLVSTIDILAESFDVDRIHLFTDHIDEGLLKDLNAEVSDLRTLSSRTSVLKAYDRVEGKPVSRIMTINAHLPGIDVTRVTELTVIGKE